MKYRRLGRTELTVSEIGFGCWGIGKVSWIGADDQVSIAALITARDAGITFFDTALAYGKGHSERLLARVLGKDNEVVLASKVPPKNMRWPARPGTPLNAAFPREYVLGCLRTTLRNLEREAIDLYQFHVWTDNWATDQEWCATVEEIRKSGQARFIGVSVNDHQPTNVTKALETGLVDCVQVIYNIFDQSPEDELFPFCQKHDIGIIGRVPLDEGGLTGTIRPGVTFPNGDFRNHYFAAGRKQDVWNRVQRLVASTKIHSSDLPKLALRFCLSNPAVATTIPGMRMPAHVRANAAISDEAGLSSELLLELRQHRWLRNFYIPPTNWVNKVKAAVQRYTRSPA
jgi:aryl-alcohol dehydrogenase-like predicted oxidoreductase